MNSEKVKGIKKALKQIIKIGIGDRDEKEDEILFVSIADILTYINELESVNDEQYKRIMELEQDLIHADEKVFYRECNVALRENEIKEQAIKQFAEKVKDSLEEYRLENEYFTKDEPNGNLWQMNASVFCIDVTQDGGLIDQLAKECLNES